MNDRMDDGAEPSLTPDEAARAAVLERRIAELEATLAARWR